MRIRDSKKVSAAHSEMLKAFDAACQKYAEYDKAEAAWHHAKWSHSGAVSRYMIAEREQRAARTQKREAKKAGSK